MKRKTRLLRKLVRDKIPEEIAEEDRFFRKSQVSGQLKDLLLRRKVVEEVCELCNARDPELLKEELADVFEILYALAKEHGILIEEIESIRVAKRKTRGGFDEGIFVDYVGRSDPSLQPGLFGPMDYVSVTRRTLRVSDIRVEEEDLLRMPLIPTHFHEEIKVGRYKVSYTDQEILVRLQPESDDRQLSLFEPEQRLSELDEEYFYELADCPDVLVKLLPRFSGYWKIYGNILLKAYGLPVPNSIILTRLTPATERAVRQFSARHNYKQLLVRHDRNPEIPESPRGGYLISIGAVARELKPFFAQNRIIMLQEPMSPYTDLYSCNAIFKKDSMQVTLEIVGPGFDASDLNRGEVTPHEIWQISCDPQGEFNLSTARRLSLVESSAYRESVRKRLAKIGRRVAGLFRIGGRRKCQQKDEQELIDLGIRTVRRTGKSLLLKHSEEYPRMGPGELEQFGNMAWRFRSCLESEHFLWRDEIILSMSLLVDRRLACWQVLWPEKKYKI